MYVHIGSDLIAHHYVTSSIYLCPNSLSISRLYHYRSKKCQRVCRNYRRHPAHVDDLGKDAQAKRITLNDKQEAADKAMVMITEALEEATVRRADVQALKAEMEEAEANAMRKSKSLRMSLVK